MKILLYLAGAIALACAPTMASAQTATLPQVKNAGGANVPSQGALLIDSTGAAIGPGNPLVIADGPLAAAVSAPLSGTATSGTTIVGPFAPQLGRDLRITLRGTWTGTFAVGTSVDACVTVSPLTIGGMTWGSFSGNANEVVDRPTLAGVVYCATATVSSGSLSYGVRQ